VNFVRRASSQRHPAPASAAEIRRVGSTRPNSVHHRLRPAFRHLQARHAAVSGSEAIKKILLNMEMRPDRDCRQGHPKDHPGKAYIRDIVQLSRDPDIWRHVVFVEDYDIEGARELVQGVDLWLNNPPRRRGVRHQRHEGRLNGVLNLSVLDGWFDEAYEQSGGWAIGDRETYFEEQDALHASNVYYLLENEIVPMFYDAATRSRASGSASETEHHARQPQFDCRRMVRDICASSTNPPTRPACACAQRLRAAREWAGGTLASASMGPGALRGDRTGPVGAVTSGRPVPVRAAIDLAGLSPDDVRVEVVIGRVGIDGGLEIPR